MHSESSTHQYCFVSDGLLDVTDIPDELSSIQVNMWLCYQVMLFLCVHLCLICMYVCPWLLLPEAGGVMQAFLKGATVQTTRPQKDKTAGPSTEKKARPIPWVEK